MQTHSHMSDQLSHDIYVQVMPLFPWHDGSHKYLHVDVHGLEHYAKQLESFITNTFEPRLRWLFSGSKMPFGVLTERQVLLVLDSSFPVLAQILVLQQHMKTLLQEQLSLVEEFNLMRYVLNLSLSNLQFLSVDHALIIVLITRHLSPLRSHFPCTYVVALERNVACGLQVLLSQANTAYEKHGSESISQ